MKVTLVSKCIINSMSTLCLMLQALNNYEMLFMCLNNLLNEKLFVASRDDKYTLIQWSLMLKRIFALLDLAMNTCKMRRAPPESKPTEESPIVKSNNFLQPRPNRQFFWAIWFHTIFVWEFCGVSQWVHSLWSDYLMGR